MNRSKKRMQFGLGTIMILTTALCVWFAWEGRPAFQAGGTPGLKRALVSLAFTAAVAVGRWRAFEKAGLPGWGAVVPIYNYFLVLRLARWPWYWMLLLLIPCVNLIVLIIVNIDVAKRFGKSGGFGLGLCFLGFIFWPILGFGAAQLRSPACAPQSRARSMGACWAISDDGRWLVAAENNTAELRDLTASDPVAAPLVLQGDSRDGFESLAITPDSRWLVAVSHAQSRLCDLASHDPTASPLTLRGHVIMSNDRRWLVAHQLGATVQLWDLAASVPAPRELGAHGRRITSMAVSADGRWMVTGSKDDKVARLWDLTARDPAASIRELRGHEGAIRSSLIGPDSEMLITIGGPPDETALLWELNVDSSADGARRTAGRDVTPQEMRQYSLDVEPNKPN